MEKTTGCLKVGWYYRAEKSTKEFHSGEALPCSVCLLLMLIINAWRAASLVEVLLVSVADWLELGEVKNCFNEIM